jgi:hypothetical protein
MKVPIDAIARFLNEGWPKPDGDWYLEDNNDDLWEEYLNQDNPQYVARVPGTLVKLEDFDCAICYQGPGEAPSASAGWTFVKLFKKWYRGLSVTLLSVEVPNDMKTSIVHQIEKLGGKVLV